MTRHTRPDSGFALLLALMAILTMTVLALGALSVAGADVVVASSYRKKITTYNTATSGLHEAREFVRKVSIDPDMLADVAAEWNGYTLGECVPLQTVVTNSGWTNPPPIDTAVSTGTLGLGQPTTCITKNVYFSGPAPGYSMETGTAGGGSRQYQMVAWDLKSEATYPGISGPGAPVNPRSSVGGFISMVCESPCGR
jgi:Tfp pilus assembly protein PilX